MMRRLVTAREDTGAGMVIVLAAIFLTAMMTTAILASTIFTVRHTTATRANVEAVAAAEAGAQLVVQGLRMNPSFPCAGTYNSPAGSEPEYDVEVFYVARGAAANSWVQGCPPEDVDKLRVVANGYAQAKGVSTSSRDTAKTEVLLERPNPVPRFTKALFGDLNMNINTSLNVYASGSDSADLFTNGNFTCSTQTSVEGNLFVRGNATLSSSPCTVDGAVVVEGNATCAAGTTIGQDLYVQGNLTLTGNAGSPCVVGGDMWVGGSTSNSTGGGSVIGRDLLVRQDLSFTGLPVVVGQPRVGGSIAGGSGHWHDQFMAAYPTATQHDGTVGRPPSIPPDPDNEMPKLSADDEMWSGWANGNWHNAITALKPPGNSMPPCNLNWGGNQFTGPLTIDSNTVFDLRSTCSGGLTLGASLNIVLNADAVILANSVTLNGDLHIETGDGQEHTLYIVVPWPAGQVNCSSAGGNITLSSGAWTQDNRSKVLLYAPNTIRIGIWPTPQIRGQLYACNIDAQSGLNVTYAPAGDVETDTTLAALRLDYMRDVTD